MCRLQKKIFVRFYGTFRRFQYLTNSRIDNKKQITVKPNMKYWNSFSIIFGMKTSKTKNNAKHRQQSKQAVALDETHNKNKQRDREETEQRR